MKKKEKNKPASPLNGDAEYIIKNLKESLYLNVHIPITSVIGNVLMNGGTGECHGTGCSQPTGKTDTNPGVTDWEDTECGTTNIQGSLICVAGAD